MFSCLIFNSQCVCTFCLCLHVCLWFCLCSFVCCAHICVSACVQVCLLLIRNLMSYISRLIKNSNLYSLFFFIFKSQCLCVCLCVRMWLSKFVSVWLPLSACEFVGLYLFVLFSHTCVSAHVHVCVFWFAICWVVFHVYLKIQIDIIFDLVILWVSSAPYFQFRVCLFFWFAIWWVVFPVYLNTQTNILVELVIFWVSTVPLGPVQKPCESCPYLPNILTLIPPIWAIL